MTRKRFGQHFLNDNMLIQRLVEVIAPLPDQEIIEIGPGEGALTFPILKKIHHLTVIELDRDLIQPLKAKGAGLELIIHQADALTVNFNQFSLNSEKIRVIGNLPYNISTPLLFHLVDFAPIIIDMHFMLQKEVVERLASVPGGVSYGRLSVMIQYHFKVTPLFDVPPSAFSPPPAVDSKVVRLIPHSQLPAVAKNYDYFAFLVKEAFNHRRKTLRNSLRNIITPEQWQGLSIDPIKRPENLTVVDFVYLSNETLPQ